MYGLMIIGFHCTVLPNAKREFMIKVLDKFFKKIGKNDFALVYYSGHGMEQNVSQKTCAPLVLEKYVSFAYRVKTISFQLNRLLLQRRMSYR
jgi:Caspase domain